MKVKYLIDEALRSIGVHQTQAEIEVPRHEKHGDLATPVAMLLAKSLRKPPREIAESLATQLLQTGAFEKVEVAGPGFVNLFYKKQFLFDELKALLDSPSQYLRQNIGQAQKVQVEFVSANPTGPLHLGHGRGAAVGAALSNLLSRAGYDVEKEFYINDAGRQVYLLGESIYARLMQLKGQQYPFPEEGYRGEYILELARKFIETHPEITDISSFEKLKDKLIEFGIQQMLKEIKNDLSVFGVEFDRWQSEKALYENGLVERCLNELRQKDLLYEKEGALWFKAELFGDEKDRVVIKSDGSPTYFCSDIAYHWYKLQRGFDRLINIWGADHHGYIPRIKAVLKALTGDDKKLTIHLVQMVNLLRGGKPIQMSKRTGEFVTLREVIEEVGSDITKFVFLTRRSDAHLDFDIETVKMQSAENPVFYVQYAHARINSIFQKATENELNASKSPALEQLNTKEEISLIKKLIFYPLMFESAVRALEPHRITFYLQELSKQFHSFYTVHRVLGNPPELTGARLALCKATMEVLKEGLSILGITAPERM